MGAMVAAPAEAGSCCTADRSAVGPSEKQRPKQGELLTGGRGRFKGAVQTLLHYLAGSS